MVRRVFGFVLIMMVLVASPVKAESPASSVAKQLVCQCGCTLTVANCTHDTCGSRDEMSALIVQKLDEGLPEAQVMQFFVAEYGEQVLASPTKKGFNLVAWITPFAVIIIGGALIYLALKRWVWQGRVAEAEGPAASDTDDETYRLRLEQELKRFGEEGYR